MATQSHALTGEPADIVDELSLSAGTYAFYYTGKNFCYITDQDRVADVNDSVAATMNASAWLKVTVAAGDHIYMWSPNGGRVIVFDNVEPY